MLRPAFNFLTINVFEHVLFLDHDGTITPRAANPDQAYPPPAMRRTLNNLSECGLKIAFVSDRSIKMLDRFYAPLKLPAFSTNGFEFRETINGPIQRPRIEPIHTQWRNLAQAITTRYGGFLELKSPVHLSFHVRDIKDEDLKKKALETFTHLMKQFISAHQGYELTQEKQVLEIRPAVISDVKMDKGKGIAHFMKLNGWQGKIPIFCGDDGAISNPDGTIRPGIDEDGFRQVRSYGGIAILVGGQNRNRRGISAATHRIDSPAQLLSGLTTLAHNFAFGAVSRQNSLRQPRVRL